MVPRKTYIRHTGEEQFEVMLTYSPEQVAEIDRVTQDGSIVVDTVVLIWTRQVGQSWVRYTAGRNGSRAEGNEKIANARGSVGPRKSRPIYTGKLRETARWVDNIPRLRAAIEEAESALPK